MATLAAAWRVIRSNGRSSLSRETRREIQLFDESAETSLNRIQRQLGRNVFKFRPATGVAIPKKDKKAIRPLVVAPIESRIVQRAIHDLLLELPGIRHFTENPHSFGGVRKQPGADLAAVPAAIQAVLDAIKGGATYVIRSDISSFFTRIPKGAVISIVADATNDADFMKLFAEAITVELENLAELKEAVAEFPIHEIGVAQGNSLSPLLGNLYLNDFDQEMNSTDCRCIRYIDDFIILAPSQASADRQFSLALKLLRRLGMKTSDAKTSKGLISNGFEFLGIELITGAIRPSKKAREKIIAIVSKELDASTNAFLTQPDTKMIPAQLTLIRTLNDVRGIVQGWGNHYSFCNEKHVLSQLDKQIDELLKKYLSIYASTRAKTDQKGSRRLIGIPLIEELASEPFSWPKRQP